MPNSPVQTFTSREHLYQIPAPPGYWQEQARKDIRPYIAEMLGKWLPPPAKILEIGCGSGRNALPLSERGYDVFALDLALEPVKIGRSEAERRNLGLQFLSGRAQNLPFTHSEFAGVLLPQDFLSIFHGRDNRLEILHEARRVLADKGILIISIQNGRFNPSLWHFLYYLYCRIFIYPLPRFTWQKSKDFFLRFKQMLQSKWSILRNPEFRVTKDVYLTAPFLGQMRQKVPYHLYDWKTFQKEIADSGFQIVDRRDYLECRTSYRIPSLLRRGSPYLVYALRKAAP